MEGVGPLEGLVAALPRTTQGPLVAVNLLVGDQPLAECEALPATLVRTYVGALVLLDMPAHERLAAEVHATSSKGAPVGLDAPAEEQQSFVFP